MNTIMKLLDGVLNGPTNKVGDRFGLSKSEIEEARVEFNQMKEASKQAEVFGSLMGVETTLEADVLEIEDSRVMLYLFSRSQPRTWLMVSINNRTLAMGRYPYAEVKSRLPEYKNEIEAELTMTATATAAAESELEQVTCLRPDVPLIDYWQEEEMRLGVATPTGKVSVTPTEDDDVHIEVEFPLVNNHVVFELTSPTKTGSIDGIVSTDKHHALMQITLPRKATHKKTGRTKKGAK